MFQPHVPVGHIWFVFGYAGETTKEEYKGKRTEDSLKKAIKIKRRKYKDTPIFIYYEDSRTEYGPFNIGDLVNMKVLTNTGGSFKYKRVPKSVINGTEWNHIPITVGTVQSGFKEDKLPSRKELRQKDLENVSQIIKNIL
jgi:hypothetical protein